MARLVTSEMRQVSDEQLQALSSPGFPVSDTDPSEPIPVDLEESADEDDWTEPAGRWDEADRYDEDEDDEED